MLLNPFPKVVTSVLLMKDETEVVPAFQNPAVDDDNSVVWTFWLTLPEGCLITYQSSSCIWALPTAHEVSKCVQEGKLYLHLWNSHALKQNDTIFGVHKQETREGCYIYLFGSTYCVSYSRNMHDLYVLKCIKDCCCSSPPLYHKDKIQNYLFKVLKLLQLKMRMFFSFYPPLPLFELCCTLLHVPTSEFSLRLILPLLFRCHSVMVRGKAKKKKEKVASLVKETPKSWPHCFSLSHFCRPPVPGPVSTISKCKHPKVLPMLDDCADASKSILSGIPHDPWELTG